MDEHVSFEIVQDEDGYPPVAVERVWARRHDDDTFEIDNIPFFARAATVGDLVATAMQNERRIYVHTILPSSNSLLRVVYFAPTDPETLRNELEALGCETELLSSHALIAVNVPALVPLDRVQVYLHEGYEAEQWDYEEVLLRQ